MQTLDQFCDADSMLKLRMEAFIEYIMCMVVPPLMPFGWWAEVKVLVDKYIVYGKGMVLN